MQDTPRVHMSDSTLTRVENAGTTICAHLEVTVAKGNHFVGLDAILEADRELSQEEWEALVCMLWADDPDPEYPDYEVFSVRVRSIEPT